MILDYLSHKKIAVWGAGKEGLAVRTFLKTHTQNSTIIDITEDNTDDIFKADILIKSPGVSLYRQEITKAKNQGITILSGSSLFFKHKHPQTKVIAVTGTKGKSTTASLIYHTLKTAGFNVALGGNIGTPLINFVDESLDYVVAELSSYQCADLNGSADIALLNNLYHEHLQWHGTHEQYYQDKLNLIKQANQVILNYDNDDILTRTKAIHNPIYFNNETGFYLKNNAFYYQNDQLFDINILNLKGLHNAQNACAVLSVAKILNISSDKIKQAFQTFQALPHRLEVIGVYQTITCVDDSISTTPETTLAGLKAFDNNQFITVLVGGLDRGQNYAVLLNYLETIKDRCHLIAMPDTGKDVFNQAQLKQIPVSFAEDMTKAIMIAKQYTRPDGLILLSPGAPSYNAYKNFEERGNIFKETIQSLFK